MSANAGALAARLSLDAAGFKAEMAAAGTVGEREMKRISRQVQFVNDYIREMGRAQKEATSSSAGLATSAKHMEEFGFQTAGAKRELLVLVHELSQGNYSKFGGSMLVLGERTGAASLLFSGMGLAVLGVAAALGTFALAALKGHDQSVELAKSLTLTGNAAGVTGDSMKALSALSAKAAGVSIGTSREALQALVWTGQFGPRLLAPASEAVAKLEKVSGQSSDEIVKDFAKMNDGVSKWAAEHNKQFNFITASQYQYIKQQDDLGNKEEAMKQVFASLNERLNTTATYWEQLKQKAGTAWDSMMGLGRQATVGDKLQQVNDRLAVLNAAQAAHNAPATFFGNPRPPDQSKAIEIEQQQKQMLLMDQLRQGERAIADAESARVTASGIHARQVSDQILSEIKNRTSLTREIEKQKRLFEDAKTAGAPYSAAEQKGILDEIKKKWTPAQKKEQYPLSAIRGDLAPGQYDYLGNAGRDKDRNRFLASEKQAYLDLAAAESKASKAAATMQKERDKSFNSWFQKFNEDEIAKSMPQSEANNSAIGKYLRDIGNQTKQAETLVTGSFQRMEDAITTFATTGKLSFSDLFSFMSQQYIRNLIQMAEKKYLLDDAGNFVGMGQGLSNVFTAASGFFGFGHKAGLDYVPYDGYPAILHQGERVQTAVEARGSSAAAQQPASVTNNFSVGAGVTRGDVMSLLQAYGSQLKGEILLSQRNGGAFAR